MKKTLLSYFFPLGGGPDIPEASDVPSLRKVEEFCPFSAVSKHT